MTLNGRPGYGCVLALTILVFTILLLLLWRPVNIITQHLLAWATCMTTELVCAIVNKEMYYNACKL